MRYERSRGTERRHELPFVRSPCPALLRPIDLTLICYWIPRLSACQMLGLAWDANISFGALKLSPSQLLAARRLIPPGMVVKAKR